MATETVILPSDCGDAEKAAFLERYAEMGEQAWLVIQKNRAAPEAPETPKTEKVEKPTTPAAVRVPRCQFDPSIVGREQPPDALQDIIDESANVLGLLRTLGHTVHAAGDGSEANSDLLSSILIAVGRMGWIYDELINLQEEGKA